MKQHPLLQICNLNEFFQKEVDKRNPDFPKFDEIIFEKLTESNFLNSAEELEIKSLTDEYQKNIKHLSEGILKKEYERLIIDLSWKSAQMEGNTYSLLETEALLSRQEIVGGHSFIETQMILNHKEAFKFIFHYRQKFKQFTIDKIEDLHRTLVHSLNVKYGIRTHSVGIVGTTYKPLKSQYYIQKALETLIAKLNHIQAPMIKAIFAISVLSYIQPFEDGNKRTARLLGNAILLSNNYCPLSYRNINEIDYKKALLVFYENQNIQPFKELILAQYRFAVENYFC
jgi:Fic family protein